MNKKLLQTAQDILSLELQLQTGFTSDNGTGSASIAQICAEMDRIANGLTLEEMAEVDEYIQKVIKKCSTGS